MIKRYYRVEGIVSDWLVCHYDYDKENFSQTEAIADFIYSIIDDFKLKVEDIKVTEIDVLQIGED